MAAEKTQTERRPALDGLRAVAVLLVFGFHVSAPHMSGGFLGVDLFFVLSGYLITSLLLTEAARTSTIAVGTFWARRVRRLLPAFLVVAVTVAIWGAWKSPGYLREKLRDDLLASLAYIANWRFIRSTSYFANDEIASPLQQQKKDLKTEIDWLTSSGAHVFIVEQDRPGLGIQTLCPPGACSFFVKFIRDRYDLTEKWNKMLRDTAAADPRITVFSIDDVFCHDHNVPCDDSLGSGLARPDGSHFSPESAPIVSAALLDRIGHK